MKGIKRTKPGTGQRGVVSGGTRHKLGLTRGKLNVPGKGRK